MALLPADAVPQRAASGAVAEGDPVSKRPRLAAVPPVSPSRPVAMTQLERQQLQANWAERVCPYCGRAHQGGAVCPRVKTRTETRTGPNVQSITVEFWPDGKWQAWPDDLTVHDVWPDGVPATPPPTAPIEASATERPPKRKKKRRAM